MCLEVLEKNIHPEKHSVRNSAVNIRFWFIQLLYCMFPVHVNASAQRGSVPYLPAIRNCVLKNDLVLQLSHLQLRKSIHQKSIKDS